MKLYIETSVIGFLYAYDSKERMNITRMFFRKSLKNYDVFISDLTLKERDNMKESKIMKELHRIRANMSKKRK